MRSYHPNVMVMSLAFIMPATQFSIAMLIGALVTRSWLRRDSESFDIYGYAIAAGLVSGEGIGGVINAALEVLGISGRVYGTQFGCPGGRC